jgi:hypothetical protein
LPWCGERERERVGSSVLVYYPATPAEEERKREREQERAGEHGRERERGGERERGR